MNIKEKEDMMDISAASTAPMTSSASQIANDSGLNYNRQQDVQEMNEATGMEYDLEKEVAAQNGSMLLNMFA
jgi:hypothetical protein